MTFILPDFLSPPRHPPHHRHLHIPSNIMICFSIQFKPKTSRLIYILFYQYPQRTSLIHITCVDVPCTSFASSSHHAHISLSQSSSAIYQSHWHQMNPRFSSPLSLSLWIIIASRAEQTPDNNMYMHKIMSLWSLLSANWTREQKFTALLLNKPVKHPHIQFVQFKFLQHFISYVCYAVSRGISTLKRNSDILLNWTVEILFREDIICMLHNTTKSKKQ